MNERPPREETRPRRRVRPLWLVLAALVVVVVAALSSGGAPGVSALDALRRLAFWSANGLTWIATHAIHWRSDWSIPLPLPGSQDELVDSIVLGYRLPRVMLLLLAGAAFASAGATMQAALQNPLADPGLLGVSSGAALGAVFAYSIGWADVTLAAVPLSAFAGALAGTFATYAIAHIRGAPSTTTLLLTGVAISSFASSLISILLLAAGNYRIHEIFAWLLGSAEGRTWVHFAWSAPPIVLGILLLWSLQRVIDALSLGEEHAQSIGVDLARGRGALFVLVALVAGAAVAVVGPVGFIGLMAPHLLRAVGGASSRRLIPLAALGGGALLIGCDLLARLVSPWVDVPVGVVSGLLGVPFFLALLHRMR